MNFLRKKLDDLKDLSAKVKNWKGTLQPLTLLILFFLFPTILRRLVRTFGMQLISKEQW